MSGTVLIAGASGVVGQRAVEHLLRSDEVGRLVAVGRRVLPIEHEKLASQVADLNDKADLLAKLPDGIAVAICALGTTIKQAGSQEAFRKVDHDAVLTFAEAALEKGTQRFVLVSSVGANAKSGNFYLRTKGETEADLAKLGFANLTVLRPSFIDPQGSRRETRRGESIGLPLMKMLFAFVAKQGRYAPITAKSLGKAVVRLSFDTTAERVRIVEGKPLHEAGL